jgi:uncharacterized protein involved in exopolysaccharide biosynthesis
MEHPTERRTGAGQAMHLGDGPPPANAASPAVAPAEVSLVALANVVLRHRAIVLWTTVLVTALTVANLVSRPRTYRSTATFVEQSRRSGGTAAGLAAQFGLSLPGVDAAQSPQFYVDLLKSRTILGPLVDRTYRVTTPEGAVRQEGLADIYGVEGRTPALRRDAAMVRLGRSVSASVASQTGVVTLNVDAHSPELAEQIAVGALQLVNSFNLERRQTQAGAELRFTEQRLAEARAELRAAEARLESFLEQNRAYANAPALRLAYDQITREVNFRQQVYTTLAEAHERARLDAVRDTPVITVIEAPEVPVRPRPRGLAQWTAVALAVGLLLGVAGAFVREYMLRTAAGSGADLDEFRALRHDVLGNVRRPWRPVLRLLRLGPRA